MKEKKASVEGPYYTGKQISSFQNKMYPPLYFSKALFINLTRNKPFSKLCLSVCWAAFWDNLGAFPPSFRWLYHLFCIFLRFVGCIFHVWRGNSHVSLCVVGEKSNSFWVTHKSISGCSWRFKFLLLMYQVTKEHLLLTLLPHSH